MDPIVVVIIIVVLTPLAVILALAKASSMRGPLSRPESKRRVESLVTEVIPEEHPHRDADAVASSADAPEDAGAPGSPGPPRDVDEPGGSVSR